MAVVRRRLHHRPRDGERGPTGINRNADEGPLRAVQREGSAERRPAPIPTARITIGRSLSPRQPRLIRLENAHRHALGQPAQGPVQGVRAPVLLPDQGGHREAAGLAAGDRAGRPRLSARAARDSLGPPDADPYAQPSEPILFPKLRIYFADFPYLHCSIDQRLLTLET